MSIIYLVDFIIISVIIVVSAILAIEAKEIIYAIFFFDLFTIGIAGIFLLFNAGYLTMFELAVYAGAVIVTVLFAVMLTKRTGTGKEIFSKASWKMRGASFALVITILAFMSILISRYTWITTSNYPTVHAGEIFDYIVSNYEVAFLILGLIIAGALIGSVALLREQRKEDNRIIKEAKS